MISIGVFDIDGTLADESGKEPLGWEFYSQSENIVKAPFYASVLGRIKAYEIVIFLTAREEDLRGVTTAWLDKVLGQKPYTLIMRPSGTYSKDPEVRANFKRLTLRNLLPLLRLRYDEFSLSFYENDREALERIAKDSALSEIRLFICNKGVINSYGPKSSLPKW